MFVISVLFVQINNHLENPTQLSKSPSSVIYDIVLGAHGVPRPPSSQERNSLCRSMSLHKGILSLDALLENINTEKGVSGTATEGQGETFNEEDFLRHITNPISATTISRECADLKRAQSIVDASTALSSDSVAPTGPGVVGSKAIYIREFNVGDIGNLLAQLRANSLRIHTKKDRFGTLWSRQAPMWAETGPVGVMPEEDRKSDFELILDQLASVFSLGSSFSDPLADRERVGRAASSLTGLLWEEGSLTVIYLYMAVCPLHV